MELTHYKCTFISCSREICIDPHFFFRRDFMLEHSINSNRKWAHVCFSSTSFRNICLKASYILFFFCCCFKISDSLLLVCWIRPMDQVDIQPSCRHSVTMRTVMIVLPLIVHDDGADDSIGRCPNPLTVCYCCCWAIDDGYCLYCSAKVYSIHRLRRPIYYYSRSNLPLIFLH